MYSVEKYYKMLSLIKIYVKSTIIVTSLVNGDLTEKCWFFRKKKKENSVIVFLTTFPANLNACINS